jgi:hypothetical protein
MRRHYACQALQVLLQESRADARNGDAIAVAEFKHRVAMRVGGDRRRKFLRVLDVGEMVKLDRFVLRIEVVDRLRAFTRMEHECVIAGAAN